MKTLTLLQNNYLVSTLKMISEIPLSLFEDYTRDFEVDLNNIDLYNTHS